MPHFILIHLAGFRQLSEYSNLIHYSSALIPPVDQHIHQANPRTNECVLCYVRDGFQSLIKRNALLA